MLYNLSHRDVWLALQAQHSGTLDQLLDVVEVAMRIWPEIMPAEFPPHRLF
jgi:hypothetical protein